MKKILFIFLSFVLMLLIFSGCSEMSTSKEKIVLTEDNIEEYLYINGTFSNIKWGRYIVYPDKEAIGDLTIRISPKQSNYEFQPTTIELNAYIGAVEGYNDFTDYGVEIYIDDTGCGYYESSIEGSAYKDSSLNFWYDIYRVD